MKTLFVAFCILLYIAIGLPFSALIGMYYLLHSVPKTWAIFHAKLFGPKKQSEAKELEEKYTKLYKDILVKLAREAEPPKPEKLEVFTISGKWGNC